MATVDERSERHEQVPIARAQVRSLRTAALQASNATDTAPYDALANALTSNVLAGLALELGLKTFYMTYFHEAAHGHSLKKLFANLPDQIRNDIRETYSFSFKDKHRAAVKLYALRRSPDQPDTPERWTGPTLADAANVIELASETFVKSRYYFEQVNGREWAVLVSPVFHMIAVSEVLDCVYDAYIERGGWA